MPFVVEVIGAKPGRRRIDDRKIGVNKRWPVLRRRIVDPTSAKENLPVEVLFKRESPPPGSWLSLPGAGPLAEEKLQRLKSASRVRLREYAATAQK